MLNAMVWAEAGSLNLVCSDEQNNGCTTTWSSTFGFDWHRGQLRLFAVHQCTLTCSWSTVSCDKFWVCPSHWGQCFFFFNDQIGASLWSSFPCCQSFGGKQQPTSQRTARGTWSLCVSSNWIKVDPTGLKLIKWTEQPAEIVIGASLSCKQDLKELMWRRRFPERGSRWLF